MENALSIDRGRVRSMICSYQVAAEAVMDESRASQGADALGFQHAHHARRACGELPRPP
jgi:hypothetical protein